MGAQRVALSGWADSDCRSLFEPAWNMATQRQISCIVDLAAIPVLRGLESHAFATSRLLSRKTPQPRRHIHHLIYHLAAGAMRSSTGLIFAIKGADGLCC